MEAPNSERRLLRFGSFELDLRSRELRNGSARSRLQEQPFEILRLMLERAGDVVTRDELRQRLWPTGTFVDFEHSLNAAIKRLRAALGDDAEQPRFVETVPRRGYRFIARAVDADSARAQERCATAPRLRLAVLPFSNLSDDSSQEYFSDGLTEELIAQLGPAVSRAGRHHRAMVVDVLQGHAAAGARNRRGPARRLPARGEHAPRRLARAYHGAADRNRIGSVPLVGDLRSAMSATGCQCRPTSRGGSRAR
jgi:DNA-binding winged helix-turn-helix (wHTH) protein